jgi:transporter family protein
LGSAFFAALTAILAKVGVRDVDSNLATAIRTAVILGFAWAIVAAQGNLKLIDRLDARTWIFLALSGLATGASWLFYFRALQLAPASRVVPIDKMSLALTLLLAFIFLKEKIDTRTLLGTALITIGTLIVALPHHPPARAGRSAARRSSPPVRRR